MFLPSNETDLSEEGSFLNGLFEVFGVRHMAGDGSAEGTARIGAFIGSN